MTDTAAAIPASDLAVYRGLFQSMTGSDAALTDDDGQVPLQAIKNLQKKVAAFHLSYKFAIDELTTKVAILQEEFEHTHDYSPIEHVRTRLKSMDSIIEKVKRTGTPPDVDSVRARIRDIAGLRITCAFVADAYWVADMLMAQADREVPVALVAELTEAADAARALDAKMAKLREQVRALD